MGASVARDRMARPSLAGTVCLIGARRALIRAKRALQESGGELHIADVPPKVMKELTDLRLAEVLELHPGESATEVAGKLRRDRIASNGTGPAH
jgi:hypothetical protein